MISKQLVLESILDVLCKMTERDIFIMLPEKKEERIPYLIKEIKITLDKINA